MVAGIDSYFDEAENDNGDADYFGSSNRVSYGNVGAFAQAHIRNEVLPVFLGARLDNHNKFGSAFSPRVGIAKEYESWHFKLLYSRAFRAPAIENIHTDPDIKPEKTGVAELELGFEMTPNMLLTANVFEIRISDPIVYFFDLTLGVERYGNFDQTGSRGFEIDYRYKSQGNSVGINFSYYTSKGINEVALYQVPGKDGFNLAWPATKINAYGSFRFAQKITVNPTITFFSKRYGYTQFDANDELIIEEFAPQTFINIFLNYEIIKELNLGLGVYDILDEGQLFIQPYKSGHTPFPGIGREIVVRANYTLPFGN